MVEISDRVAILGPRAPPTVEAATCLASLVRRLEACNEIIPAERLLRQQVWFSGLARSGQLDELYIYFYGCSHYHSNVETCFSKPCLLIRRA